MKPEVGKWYWVQFGGDAEIMKCIATNGNINIMQNWGWRLLRSDADIISEYTPTRRWWQIWRSK